MPRKKKEQVQEKAPTVDVIRGFPITLPGQFVPEVKGKEILLVARVNEHLSHLIEVRSLNPKFKETNNPFIDGDKPEPLQIAYCATEISQAPVKREQLAKIIEEAALKYFKRQESNVNV